jgi:hypothetical protein
MSLGQSLTQAVADRQQDALPRYREIILANDSSDGIGQELLNLCATLGLSIADVESDIAASASVRYISAQLTSDEDLHRLKQADDGLCSEIERLQTEAKEALDRIASLRPQLMTSQYPTHVKGNHSNRIRNATIQRQHPRIFDAPDSLATLPAGRRSAYAVFVPATFHAKRIKSCECAR